MAAEEEAQRVTMSNTKKEILTAYHELLDEYRERKEQTLDAQERIQDMEVQKAVTVAEGLSPERVTQNIGNLKADLGGLLGQLSDRLESEVAKFDSVRRAIEAREKELQEIYGIQKEAGTLAALIQVQKQKREEFEREMTERRARLEAEIEDTRRQWQREKEQHSDEEAERETEEARRRQRAKEEWQYDFDREKRRARDAFEEEKVQAEKEMQRRTEDINRREEELRNREQELMDLRSRLQDFEVEKGKAVEAAIQETMLKTEEDSKTREQLLSKDFSAERNVLQARIESLEKTVVEQNRQILYLSERQEKAYQQVQDIALRAVEGAASLKAITAAAGESSRRKSTEE